ncbi:MAG: phosphatidate cytidylyltransferase [Armatimonadetes bacterium]|nr:phosphatidate cytidylyltransferase [Armatimonadota bacterium]
MNTLLLEFVDAYTWFTALLITVTVAGILWEERTRNEEDREVVRRVNARFRSWWVLWALFSVAKSGPVFVVLLGLLSFQALREFITLTPTRSSDHAALLVVFFLITPLQYALVAFGAYGLFCVLIPVYSFLFIPALLCLSGDSHAFVERTARLQWALMVCVYCISHAPAIELLEIPGYHAHDKLLLLLFLVVEIGDVVETLVGRYWGKWRLSPKILPSLTVEGLAAGLATATAIGALLWWNTPYTLFQAAAVSFMTALAGVAGKVTMAAIKRDRAQAGIWTEGYGGVLNRLAPFCFASPVFVHVTRFLFDLR